MASSVVVGLVLGLLLGLLPGWGSAAPGASTPPPAAQPEGDEDSAQAGDADRVAARADELRREAADRDAGVFDELVTGAGAVVLDLSPMVEEAGRLLEPGAVPPDQAVTTGWSRQVAAAVTTLPPATSAGTDVNVARAALEVALLDLAVAADAYDQAAAAQAQGLDPTGLLRTGGDALRAGVATWSVGATQLDAVSTERGRGHVHEFLPAVAGSPALTPDPEPAP